jgi:hypothetical protein
MICCQYQGCQYQADRTRRALRGTGGEVTGAAKAVDGLSPVKRNRFTAPGGAVKSVNRELGPKARDLAGLKGYLTNLAAARACRAGLVTAGLPWA